MVVRKSRIRPLLALHLLTNRLKRISVCGAAFEQSLKACRLFLVQAGNDLSSHSVNLHAMQRKVNLFRHPPENHASLYSPLRLPSICQPAQRRHALPSEKPCTPLQRSDALPGATKRLSRLLRVRGGLPAPDLIRDLLGSVGGQGHAGLIHLWFCLHPWP